MDGDLPVSDELKYLMEDVTKAIAEKRTYEAMLTRIAWILTNMNSAEEKVEKIQQLIGWWSMYQAGALEMNTITTFIKEPMED
jgi:hypothetical protein